jgi:DUF4097 and DUF4098 domain-containing protein YvlB
MLILLLAGATTLLSPAPMDLDTTFAVPQGARIEVENFAGEVVVTTWNRDAVRVVATHTGDDKVSVRTVGSVVRIETRARRGPSRIVDYKITVPASAALRITGPFNDVSIDGAGGDVTVETVRGEVTLKGGNGLVSLRSVQGSITVERARGRIDLNAVNEDIRAIALSGDISVDAVNGDIELSRIESANVSAATVNGTITYDGTIRDGGRYAFTTHNGEIDVAVPATANATVSIATFNGEIESELPLTLTETRPGRRFTFTVGTGSARLDLESFNGTIRLRRPGGTKAREGT